VEGFYFRLDSSTNNRVLQDITIIAGVYLLMYKLHFETLFRQNSILGCSSISLLLLCPDIPLCACVCVWGGGTKC
jgi:hypothetical protein